MRQLKKIPTHIWILAVIVLIGVFLRTYHLHEWLKFRNDQARDADLVSQVVDGERPWPLLGPYMSYSGDGDHTEANAFHLGPIYYHFQIAAALIFGNYADKLAYPDVFFGIASILLLYLFLRIAFTRNVSLGITFLYAISSYFIQYSRFAWNTNLIPFFVLLLLFSLYKFLEKGERVSWWWAVALGLAIGVGIQLHTVVLILFPVVSVCVGGYLLWKFPQIWKQVILVILVAMLFNIGQIRYELNSKFHNTRTFFETFTNRTEEMTTGYGQITLTTILNFSETFAQIVSSSGNPDQFNFPVLFDHPILLWEIYATSGYNLLLASIVASGTFFLLSCWLLIRAFRRESDLRKKEFLGLVIVYSVVTFLIFIPINDDLRPRYFLPLIFLPFLFLGLWFQFVRERFPRTGLLFGWGVLVVLVLGNLHAITQEAKAFIMMNRSNPQYVVLGEIEPMGDFISEQFIGQTNIYFFAQGKYIQNYFKPMNYILREKGMVLNRISTSKNVPSGVPVLSLSSAFVGTPSIPLAGFKVTTCKNFGNLGWCRLDPEMK